MALREKLAWQRTSQNSVTTVMCRPKTHDWRQTTRETGDEDEANADGMTLL